MLTGEFQWKRGTFFHTIDMEKLLRKQAFAMLLEKRPPSEMAR
jgi:hypothetical protein